MKKAISNVLTVCIVLALFAAALPLSAANYSDTESHWAKAAINEWSEYGVVQGSDGRFRPNDPITRAEMATVIAKLLKLDKTAENKFSDVAAGAWYTENILKCADAGVITGYTDGTFRPGNKITRQEAIVMLGRAFAIAEEPNADLSAFKDASSAASWAVGFVGAMVSRDIVHGVSDTELALSANINRASVVTILSNAIDEYVTSAKTVKVTEGSGIIIVAAAGASVEGTADNTILVTQGASDGKVTVRGSAKSVIVKGDNVELALESAAVTRLAFEGDGAKLRRTGSTVGEISGTYTDAAAGTTGGTVGGGSTGGGSTGGGSTGGGTKPQDPPKPNPGNGDILVDAPDGKWSPLF